MLLDKQSLFSDQQTLVHAAGTWLSDNVIDLGAPASHPFYGAIPYDAGKGEPKDLLCQITETFLAGAGAATVQIELVQADDAAITANVETLARSEAIPKAALVAGYQFRVPQVAPVGITRRYLAIRITIATNPGTAGKLTAGFIRDRASAPGVFV